MPEYLMTIAKMPRRRITKLSEIMTEARYMTLILVYHQCFDEIVIHFLESVL